MLCDMAPVSPVAPETDQLLATTSPVLNRAAAIAEDCEACASALRTYAEIVAEIQAPA
jgi:hypothetical protein